MSVSTVAVAVVVARITAVPLANGAQVFFEMTGPATVSGIVVAPEAVNVLLDENGTATVRLAPSPAGTAYLVTVRDQFNQAVVEGYATVPAVDCNLADILEFPASDAFPSAPSLTALGQPSGAALVGLNVGIADTQPGTVQDFVRGQVVSVFEFLTPAEKASVIARDGLVNVQGSITKAFARCAGNTLYCPPGRYVFTSLAIAAGLRVVGIPGSTVFEAAQDKPLTTNLAATDTSHAPVRWVQNLEFYGIVFDGGSLAPQRWLQAGPGGAPITDPEKDYYDAITNPTGKIGNPAFPAWTIADTVAAGRRNASYTQVAALLDLALVDGADVRMCLFRNHKGRGIFERGGRNVTIEQCGFDAICKNDGAYHAVYTQSYGTPGAGQPFYSPSENVRVRNNWARDLERSFILFGPTKGGECTGNYVVGWRESCIFVPPVINYDGGRSTITGNTLKTGIVSDIVCWGIEAGSAPNLQVDGNYIEGSQGGAIALPGANRVRGNSNTLVNNCAAFTYPYGPFSERYAFGVGTPPIAGTAVSITSLSVVQVGSQGALAGANVSLRGTDFIETRVMGSYPYGVSQTKSGSNNIAGPCEIEGGSWQVPAGMAAQFLNTAVGNVWQANMPFSIRNVVGHASEAPVIVQHFFLATGAPNIVAGFRPRSVLAYAVKNGDPVGGMMMVGAFTWKADATRPSFSVSHYGQDGAGQADALFNNAPLSMQVDGTGALTFRGNILAWTETGFTINVTTAGVGLNCEFVCFP